MDASGTGDAGGAGEMTAGADQRPLLTLEELTTRVGISVRNVRFYTTKGLLPPPIRRGRSGYYTSDHIARLELVQELQSHGYTLAAIERYLSEIPIDASPEEVALRRTMLAPWQAESDVVVSREELERRADRTLDDQAIRTLTAFGIIEELPHGHFRLAASQLTVGLGLLDVGFPWEAAVAARDIYLAAGRQVARELDEVFRTQVWPAYRHGGASPEVTREMLERLKPLSIASLVSAYEKAMDETKREQVEAKAQRRRSKPTG